MLSRDSNKRHAIKIAMWKRDDLIELSASKKIRNS